MLPRALEVLLVALLVMLTLGVAFDFQNHALLRDILEELRRQPAPVAVMPQPGALPDVVVAPPVQPQPTPAPAPVQPAPVAVPDNTVAAATPKPEPAPPINPRPDPSPSLPTEDTETPAPQPAPPVTPRPKPVVNPAPAPAPAPAEQDETWQRVGPVMTGIIQELLTGRYDDVVARFNSDMQATGLDRGALAAAVEPLRSQHGTMKQVTYHRPPTSGRVPANMTAYEIGVEMADGHPLLFTITLDAKQRISGLLMR